MGITSTFRKPHRFEANNIVLEAFRDVHGEGLAGRVQYHRNITVQRVSGSRAQKNRKEEREWHERMSKYA